MILSSPSSRSSRPSLADYSEVTMMLPELRERDMAGVIKELTHVLHQQGWVKDILPFYNAALTREYLSSTSMDNGLAFPHARTSAEDSLRFALGKSAEPIAWGAPRCALVRFTFLIVVPVSATPNYLHLLSGLAKLGKNESLMKELHQAATPQQLLATLSKIPLRQAAHQPLPVGVDT